MAVRSASDLSRFSDFAAELVRRLSRRADAA